MRLGLALNPSPDAAPLESLIAQARGVESAGLDLAWIDPDGDSVNALLTAAAIAAETTWLRLAATVRVGGHPLGIAEAAAVADNCSAGRLTLVLQDTGSREILTETADVILAACAPRPFRHQGTRWQIPANLPENDQPEQRIVVTPMCVQTELPVWLLGGSAPHVARERGLPHVTVVEGTPDGAAGVWGEAERSLGPAVTRLRRPGVFALPADPDGEFDADRVVDQLRSAGASWGLDTAVLRPPVALDQTARARVIARLATHVRPHVLMHELPAGLAAHWKEVLV